MTAELCGRERHGALRAEQPSRLERLLHQLARLVDRVDDPEDDRAVEILSAFGLFASPQGVVRGATTDR